MNIPDRVTIDTNNYELTLFECDCDDNINQNDINAMCDACQAHIYSLDDDRIEEY